MELKQELGISPELIAGKAGIFDVKADGELVFSKHKVDRFPEDGEVVKLLRTR
jgi:predicted Rdx family selenoprotein